MATVVVQKWEESEKDWGTRPDGYSLHLTEADSQAYFKEYCNRLPKIVSDDYERPDGDPYLAEVDEETFENVRKSRNGTRHHYSDPPGLGGRNGWQPTNHS